MNVLAELAIAEDASDPRHAIESGHIDAAKDTLIRRRNTHLNSLIDRLGEPRVWRVLKPLLAGEAFSSEVLYEDIQFVIDLGLMTPTRQGLTFTNPIYREVIPRVLISVPERSFGSP